MMEFEGYIHIKDGIYYKIDDGTPWSCRKERRNNERYNSFLKPIASNKSMGGYYNVSFDRKIHWWHKVVYEHFNGEIPKGMDVDHINNIRNDNRLENLRVICRQKNASKRSKQSNNTNGYIGVTYHRKNRNWNSSITLNGKRIHLGCFDTPEEAYKAYFDAKVKYHGNESVISLPIPTTVA